VAARSGVVALSGPVLAREADGLVAAVAALPGLVRVDDLLERRGDKVELLGVPTATQPRATHRRRWLAWSLGGVAVAAAVYGMVHRLFHSDYTLLRGNP
jgi:hypothetical protein